MPSSPMNNPTNNSTMQKAKQSQTFARAFLKFALHSNQLEQFFQNFTLLSQILKNTPLLKILNSPQFLLNQKKLFLNQILNQILKPHLTPQFLACLYAVLSKKSQNLFHLIYSDFKNLFYQSQNIVATQVITAKPLNTQNSLHIQSALQKKIQKKIVIQNTINQNILGGMILQFQSKQIDLSIQGHLINLKNKINKNKESST